MMKLCYIFFLLVFLCFTNFGQHFLCSDVLTCERCRHGGRPWRMSSSRWKKWLISSICGSSMSFAFCTENVMMEIRAQRMECESERCLQAKLWMTIVQVSRKSNFSPVLLWIRFCSSFFFCYVVGRLLYRQLRNKTWNTFATYTDGPKLCSAIKCKTFQFYIPFLSTTDSPYTDHEWRKNMNKT